MRGALPQDGRVWYDKNLSVTVDRVKARYAAWYEMFPRSAGTTHGRSGTFDDVIDRLDYVSELGFDTLYFPPIHPIGHTNRKGPNNTLQRGPNDPGVPYAIGAKQEGMMPSSLAWNARGFSATGRSGALARYRARHGLRH